MARQLFAAHPTPIHDWLVAEERHADGTPHIHAFIRYESKVTWSPTLWDLLRPDGSVQHGSYEVAKSCIRARNYCKKEGDYIGNINVQNANQKRASRNDELLDQDPKNLVTEGVIGLLQLPNLIKASAAFNLLGAPYESVNVRGVWVTGKSGAGKSHFVRSRHQGNLFLKSQNKWWDGYTGQHYVLLDDLDHAGQCLSHHFKIWSDKWSCTGEIKGATVNLHHRVFYVTSQYTIEEIWPGEQFAEVREALRRRFTIIGITRMEPVSKIEDEIREDN